jgi:ketosteroid isomerase-like protein
MTDLLAAEEAVLAANERFYRAIESLDIKEMEAAWLTTAAVQCIHPGWGPLSGWADVRDSWVRIFNNTSAMSFIPHILHVAVQGEAAWVLCVEEITSRHADEEHTSQVLATNLFERRDGQWFMVHHHASPVFRPAGADESAQ